MISIFLKQHVHFKWYQFFWNNLYISNDINFFWNNMYISNDINFFWNNMYISNDINFFWNNLYISNDINFSETTCTFQMISIFLKQPVHFKWYQFFWNNLYISNDINFSETTCTFQMISIFSETTCTWEHLWCVSGDHGELFRYDTKKWKKERKEKKRKEKKREEKRENLLQQTVRKTNKLIHIKRRPTVSVRLSIRRLYPPQRGNTPPKKMCLNFTWWWGSSFGYLRGVECTFILSTPTSTLTTSGRTFSGSIMGSKTIRIQLDHVKKHVNLNVQWTRFPNLLAENTSWHAVQID